MARRCPRRLIAVAAILAAFGSVTSTSKAAPDTIPRIVVLGDSLTSGRGIARTRALPLRFGVVKAEPQALAFVLALP